MTSRHKMLTPNQLVSVSPPQCQTLLEVGALMWPAAKQVPRSVVHDWTRPVCRKKKAGISLIYFLIRGICQTPTCSKTLSQRYCLYLLSFKFLTPFYLCDDSRPDLQGLNGGRLSDQRHRSLHSNRVTCWFWWIGGDSCWESEHQRFN